jgi:dTDP-L-rhamnose 4-epimerase
MVNSKIKPLVLLTGGAGFIGSHTAEGLIRDGYRVRILDCLDPQVHGRAGVFPSHLHPEIECIHGDVRSSEDLRQVLNGVSFIYHLAALTGVGQSMYDIKKYSDINVTGTANLIEVIIKEKFPIKKIILSSSRAVYGEGTHECPNCGIIYPPVRKLEDLKNSRFEVYCPNCGQQTRAVPTGEDRPLLPVSVYGWTKKLQEELFQLAARDFGLATVILRYFNVFGSRQSLVNPYTGIISIFFSRMMAAKPISIYEHGTPLRDFVHIQDVVEANLKALNVDLAPGTILNIGSGKESSVTDIALTLYRILQINPQLEDKGEFRIGDIHSCMADITRARNLLGYKSKITLEDGIQEFVAWAKKNQSVDLYQAAVDEMRSFGLFHESSSRAVE